MSSVNASLNALSKPLKAYVKPYGKQKVAYSFIISYLVKRLIREHRNLNANNDAFLLQLKLTYYNIHNKAIQKMYLATK